jgi:hypothetical protein
MKVAVGLFGIHYLNELNHWMNWKIKVDYTEGYEINKKILYDTVDVDFYSSTYFSEKTNQLLNDYKFKSIKLQHVDNKVEAVLGDNWKKRNKRFKETIQLIFDSNIDYDYVILTRYDIEFFTNPFTLNLDNDKINVTCKLYSGMMPYMIDDNFYLLSYSKLNYFYNELCKIDETIWAHSYSEYINDFNFLIDGMYYTHSMPMYKFLRK